MYSDGSVDHGGAIIVGADPPSNSQEHATFPFFDLPPELRERIYAIAMGRRTIHVAYPAAADDSDSDVELQTQTPSMLDAKRDDYTMGTSVCCARPSDLEMFQSPEQFSGEQLSDVPSFWIRHWDEDEGKCRKRPRDELALNILLCCRAAHKEARYVPFEFNTFAFAAPSQLHDLSRLVGADRFRRIRHILLYYTNYRRLWTARICKPIIVDLPFGRLQNLDVFIELCPRDLMNQQSRPVDEPEGQERALSGLKEFCLFAPKSVRILIVKPRFETYSEFCKRAENFDTTEWCERIKRMVKRPSGNEDENL